MLFNMDTTILVKDYIVDFVNRKPVQVVIRPDHRPRTASELSYNAAATSATPVSAGPFTSRSSKHTSTSKPGRTLSAGNNASGGSSLLNVNDSLDINSTIDYKNIKINAIDKKPDSPSSQVSIGSSTNGAVVMPVAPNDRREGSRESSRGKKGPRNVSFAVESKLDSSNSSSNNSPRRVDSNNSDQVKDDKDAKFDTEFVKVDISDYSKREGSPESSPNRVAVPTLLNPQTEVDESIIPELAKAEVESAHPPKPNGLLMVRSIDTCLVRRPQTTQNHGEGKRPGYVLRLNNADNESPRARDIRLRGKSAGAITNRNKCEKSASRINNTSTINDNNNIIINNNDNNDDSNNGSLHKNAEKEEEPGSQPGSRPRTTMTDGSGAELFLGGFDHFPGPPEETTIIVAAAELTSRQELDQMLLDAKPVLEQCKDAMDYLQVDSIADVFSMHTPQPRLDNLFKALCIVFDIDLEGGDNSFQALKNKFTAQTMYEEIHKLNPDNLSERKVDVLSSIISDPDFSKGAMASASVSSSHLCSWVHALHSYIMVHKKLKPLIEAVEAEGAQEEREKRDIEAAALAVTNADIGALVLVGTGGRGCRNSDVLRPSSIDKSVEGEGATADLDKAVNFNLNIGDDKISKASLTIEIASPRSDKENADAFSRQENDTPPTSERTIRSRGNSRTGSKNGEKHRQESGSDERAASAQSGKERGNNSILNEELRNNWARIQELGLQPNLEVVHSLMSSRKLYSAMPKPQYVASSPRLLLQPSGPPSPKRKASTTSHKIPNTAKDLPKTPFDDDNFDLSNYEPNQSNEVATFMSNEVGVFIKEPALFEGEEDDQVFIREANSQVRFNDETNNNNNTNNNNSNNNNNNNNNNSNNSNNTNEISIKDKNRKNRSKSNERPSAYVEGGLPGRKPPSREPSREKSKKDGGAVLIFLKPASKDDSRPETGGSASDKSKRTASAPEVKSSGGSAIEEFSLIDKELVLQMQRQIRRYNEIKSLDDVVYFDKKGFDIQLALELQSINSTGSNGNSTIASDKAGAKPGYDPKNDVKDQYTSNGDRLSHGETKAEIERIGADFWFKAKSAGLTLRDYTRKPKSASSAPREGFGKSDIGEFQERFGTARGILTTVAPFTSLHSKKDTLNEASDLSNEGLLMAMKPLPISDDLNDNEDSLSNGPNRYDNLSSQDKLSDKFSFGRFDGNSVESSLNMNMNNIASHLVDRNICSINPNNPSSNLPNTKPSSPKVRVVSFDLPRQSAQIPCVSRAPEALTSYQTRPRSQQNSSRGGAINNQAAHSNANNS